MSVISTFAVMAVLGYSLDNLSLMALTLAVGFVVDDAIVMLETSSASEDGQKTADGRLRRLGEIGFTIVSMTFPWPRCSFPCCSWAASWVGSSASSRW